MLSILHAHMFIFHIFHAQAFPRGDCTRSSPNASVCSFLFRYIYQSLCPQNKDSKSKIPQSCTSQANISIGGHLFFLQIRASLCLCIKKERTAVSLRIQCVYLCVCCSGFRTDGVWSVV